MTRTPHVHSYGTNLLKVDFKRKWLLIRYPIKVQHLIQAFSRGCKVNENSTYKRKVFHRGILSLLISKIRSLHKLT